MASQLSLSTVVSHTEFIYTPATASTPAKFELPANIADVVAVCGAHDDLSAWIVFQFAIPSDYNDQLETIQQLFISAMQERRHGR